MQSLLNCSKEGNCAFLHTQTDSYTCHKQWGESYYYWAPVDRFVDGGAALSSLISRVQSGQSVAGHLIVQSTESTAAERHLALCDVNAVSGIIGPPIHCTTVAIITSDTAWLRGGYFSGALDLTCKMSSSFRSTGAIDIGFDVLTHQSAEAFAEAFVKMMNSVLGLTVEKSISKASDGKIGNVHLTSSAALRNSTILQGGWREALDFDLDLTSDKHRVQVRGVAHVLGCRQALGSLTEYQGLNDVQKSTYATALDSDIDNAIRATCKNYMKHDSKTISCD
jgi:hypothetical protein